jgi:hypothetical protein
VALSAYKHYSGDRSDWGILRDYPTFWNVKAALIFQARPAGVTQCQPGLQSFSC